MKFAVVEYSSKTGQIWRHVDARPNYLCDPIREIDPTSFGCYVSALAGEHIPLLSFVVGPTVHPLVRIYRKVIKRITGSWPTYDISYLKQFDALLVVYQISDGHEMVSLTSRLQKEHPGQVIIGVPTQPFGILQLRWDRNPSSREEVQQFMSFCDVFLTVVKRTLPFWQEISKTPVQYMPQPYPATFASQHFKGREEKSPIIFVAGVTVRDTITKGQLVAARLQEKFPEYLIQMAQVEGMELDTKNLEGTRYEVIPFELWSEHLETLSRVTLVINTDYTQTRGRVQTDCAAVGTPSIGANSDGQDDLFPSLPAERDSSIEALVAQAEDLLVHPARYEEVTHTARERLEKYEYIPSKQRMEDLIRSIQEKS